MPTTNENHIRALRHKHAALAAQVETAKLQPGFDQLELVGLKREKLRLKDEIARQTAH